MRSFLRSYPFLRLLSQTNSFTLFSIKKTFTQPKNLIFVSSLSFSRSKNLCFDVMSLFGTQDGKKNQSVESKCLNGKVQVDNSQEENRTRMGKQIITKVMQYSVMLSGSGTQNQIQDTKQTRLEEIDKYLTEAGTTAQEISKCLQHIAKKLSFMFSRAGNWQEMEEGQAIQKKRAKGKRLGRMLEKLEAHYQERKSINQVQPIQAALFLLSLETQLTALVQLVQGTVEQSSFDIDFNHDIAEDEAFSKRFEYAWNKVELIELAPKIKAKHDIVYSALRKAVVMVTSAVVTEQTARWESQHWRKIVFGLSVVTSLFHLQKAELKCYRLWRRPKLAMIKNLLDIPEKGYLQHAKKIIYPTIKSRIFLYAHSSPQNQVSFSNQQAFTSGQKPLINIFEKSEKSNRILLLSHQELNFKISKPVQKYGSVRNLLGRWGAKGRAEAKQIQNVIIHIHGGGFISMSSELMQNYTRPWANELKIPVFSLDYRKPPTHRFPDPLQDCIAGYKFIVEQIPHFMNIRPKNIILAGDSAGGNLACALQARLIKQKYNVLPRALFLMYPAVDLRMGYSPSRLNSFSDGIFLPSLLLLCQREYLREDKSYQYNPYASPILLQEGFIQSEKANCAESQKWPLNWPKTVVMSGRKDPLFDDSIRLIERLARDGIDCKMLLYNDFSHGFMSLDQVLPGAKQAIRDSIKQLGEIIKKF